MTWSGSIPRWCVAVTCLVAVGTAATGCRGADATNRPAGAASSGSASTSAAASPTDELLAAAGKLRETTFRITMSSVVSGIEANVSGVGDPSKKVSSLTVTIPSMNEMKLEMISFGADVYLKINGFSLPGIAAAGSDRWVHIDATRVKGLGDLGLGSMSDPSWTLASREAFTSVERAGDRSYRGTLDLTKAASATGLGSTMTKVYGDAAAAMPFEATVDAQGRLATMKMAPADADDSSSVPTVEVKYSDWGTPVAVERPPAAQVEEAPPSVYGEQTA